MNNELKAYRFVLATENSNLGGVVYNSNYVYAQEDVDAILAEKDKEIAELKADNERLKKQSSCTFSDDSLRVRQLKRKIADNSEKILELQKALDVALSEAYSLLDKIESLKASHYAESVDAGMRERRLKRALWLARASEAAKEVNYWNCENESSYAIVDFNVHHETIVSYKAPHHRPYMWILIWKNVERKCRAKAEEYK